MLLNYQLGLRHNMVSSFSIASDLDHALCSDDAVSSLRLGSFTWLCLNMAAGGANISISIWALFGVQFLVLFVICFLWPLGRGGVVIHQNWNWRAEGQEVIFGSIWDQKLEKTWGLVAKKNTAIADFWFPLSSLYSLFRGTGRKSNSCILWLLFNYVQFIWHI